MRTIATITCLTLALALPAVVCSASSGSGGSSSGSSGGYEGAGSVEKPRPSQGSAPRSTSPSAGSGSKANIGAATVVDSEKYDAGKAIFSGKAALPEPDPAKKDRQLAGLRVLQVHLPETVQETVDLTQYAGRLSDDQFASLLYFVEYRYNVSAD